MPQNLRLALAQINTTVGDFSANLKKLTEYIRKAESLKADIIAFPELAITGYPPEDLLLKPGFIADNLECLKSLSSFVKETLTIAGFVDRKGNRLYNAAAVIHRKKILGVYHKMLLPNYGVFDEKRYFEAGKNLPVFKFGRCLFAVNICEDIWHMEGPTKLQAGQGARLIININASPYHAGKIREREAIVRQEARASRASIAYVNMVGGQDELVFDGQSMVIDSDGRVIGRSYAFKEDLLAVDLEIPESRIKKGRGIITIAQAIYGERKAPLPKKEIKPLDPVKEVYQALILGLSDYAGKNGFQKALIGLSGGIDSALVASLAADALGRENVHCVFMPSRYSSRESGEDAGQVAENLGVKLTVIPIEEIYKTYLAVLEPHFSGLERNIAEENLQARIRGNILMALSNKFGWLVLTTGNKSEMSTGYATLYGDMAGGFAVIKDVPKTLVYKLCGYRNSLGPVIPGRIFTKAPTAELKPDQKDSDTLPPYETLDPILKAYVEEDRDSNKIISGGFDKETVYKVVGMVDKSEYKRRQSPPGIKITPRAFGRDRRIPITNRYRG